MRNGWNWKYPLSYMYPAHTQLLAKWSSPSIGDQRATGWGSHRCDAHGAEVVARKETNAFAKHLALFHPDDQGDITNFDIQVKGLFQKPLTRQKTEAIKIQSSTATHRMNSKAEHRQPAMLRVTMTRENDDQQLLRQAGQRLDLGWPPCEGSWGGA